jgi:hypothetical protein
MGCQSGERGVVILMTKVSPWVWWNQARREYVAFVVWAGCDGHRHPCPWKTCNCHFPCMLFILPDVLLIWSSSIVHFEFVRITIYYLLVSYA